MSKLWEKGYPLDPLVESFTAGQDVQLDQKLLFYDCLGSLAHAAMLHQIGILNTQELKTLQQCLIELIRKKNFEIKQEEEDVHTAVENYLSHFGDVGQKVHTARSRNDQVNTDLRLYMKHRLHFLMEPLLQLTLTTLSFAEAHKEIPIVGRTHMQPAMPSSFGLWGGSYAESFLDDAQQLVDTYKLIDQCPLGSSSSYGVALPIDRQLTAQLLGFSKVQNNVLYANQSRGKFEAIFVSVCAHMMTDLSRMAVDLIFFALPEIAYLKLDPMLCSGSSLMPQKMNPCALELIRAKCAKVTANLHLLFDLLRPLPSGYQRDLQESKGALMESCDITTQALHLMKRVIDGVDVRPEACSSSFTQEIFATDRVLKLVEKGIPFRLAYKQVAASLKEGHLENSLENILSKTHQGAPGNLNLSHAQAGVENFSKWLVSEKKKWAQMVQNLTGECLV